MSSAKEKLKGLQNGFWDEDKRLWEEHSEVTTFEEWSWKLKELITEKKKENPDGPKKLTKEDIDRANKEIESLK